MNRNQSSSIITASMLLIGITLFLSKGWATSFTTFVEEKINNPSEPVKPSSAAWAAGQQSGFSPEAGQGQGGGGGGGGTW